MTIVGVLPNSVVRLDGAETRKYPEGVCPTCGTTAKPWVMDKPCQSPLQMIDNNMITIDSWDHIPGYIRSTDPGLPKCGSVDLQTGTYDWRQHICEKCKTMFAVRK